MKKINEKCSLILGGCLLGICFFLLIYGIRIVNVTYDSWLFSGEDITQHYFGWLYYRTADAKWPLGTINNMVDQNVSIIFMDSIPILALLCKPFGRFLPETFQYFGLWGVLSYGFTGGIASLILYKFSKNKYICWLGSLFFILSPYMLQRMFTHTSLAGQWVILIAVFLWIYNIGATRIEIKTAYWTFLLCLVTLIHLYFIPMICVFCAMDALRYCIENRRVRGVFILLVPVVASVALLYIMGAFEETGEYAVWGLGYYSANINALFNSMGTGRLLHKLPCGEGQAEGYGYLGAGILAMIVADLCIVSRHLKDIISICRQQKMLVAGSILIILAFLVLAFSPTIMFGDKILCSIQWPEIIMKILRIFRASGRFIWPVGYIIFVISIAILCYYCNPKYTFLLLGSCFLIQFIDLGPLMKVKQVQLNHEIVELESEDTHNLDIALKDKKNVVFLPYSCVYENPKLTYAIGEYAYENKLKMNSFYIARLDSAKMNDLDMAYKKAIKDGIANDCVFIFYSEKDCLDATYPLYYYKIGECIVGVTEKNVELKGQRLIR